MTNPIVVTRQVVSGDREYTQHYYWCPGCNTLHAVAIQPDKNSVGAGWEFSGTLENPTYSPSQLTRFHRKVDNERREVVCHTFIRGGQIEFLNDCTHALRGQTVPLPPLPDWVVHERDT
jgi:hypothetical protein